ncbi:MAG: isoleucine--tRNA ligase [Bacteroidetes bacterium]|nr:isoleucine--tRNA ligase [Bacteroidota bacterium]
MYNTLKHLNWPLIEEEIIRFWEADKIFEQSVDNRPEDKAFTFYEGPPSANGMPGIHHVMARAIKDIFCRYKTQQGYRVERKGGWDTHGLPIELQVEKRLGIRKDDIGVKISVEDYNRECRNDVLMFKDKWDELTRRIGYWVDLDNPYITYENSYIETLWYLLKQLYQKGYLYKGYTIQPYSPAAGTGLSSHELNQPGTYKMVKDTTIVAQFKLEQNTLSAAQKQIIFNGNSSENNVFFLAWTTTPWTLPSNTALAVGKKIKYRLIETFNPYTGIKIQVILAADLLSKYFSAESENGDFSAYKTGDKNIPWRFISEFTGADLAGIGYEQLLPYAKPDGDAFKVVTADFVSTEDGTGIVHIAPSFGADDFKTARENGIGALTLVDKEGKFTSEMGEFAHEFVKEQYLTDEEKYAEQLKQGRDKYLNVDERISIKLKQENKAFKVEKYEHTYPHCWRTDKPILYYPLESWFIKTTAVKDRLIELNKTINWKPQSTGEGRFGNWLENLVDWNLSRSRYWGTPLPIWRTEDGSEEKCIGSIEELLNEISTANEKLGLQQNWTRENLDLHRPYADQIVLVSTSGKPMKREADLIDVWFDSGAMPYAQWHWPFENKELFENNFPADYIAEGVDQTRGWFFTLHALSVLLFDSIAFKNVIANGLVLDKVGNKMSKRLGNAIDPFETVNKYGADAVRWYMITNAPPWDNLKFDVDGIGEVQRKFFGTLYNTYSFFAIYANIDRFEFDPDNLIPYENRVELDRWILSRLNSMKLRVQEAMDDYDPTVAGREIEDFVDEHLSNWYVRLSRRRFWKGEMNDDKKAAYETLFECLDTVSKLMAPISPFFSDWLYRSLNASKIENGECPKSVHLTDFPQVNRKVMDKYLEATMDIAETTCSLVLSLRKKEKIKVRQPLQKLMVPVLNTEFEKQLKHVEELIKHEVNVKELVTLNADNDLIVKKLKPNFKTLGPKLGQDMKLLAAQTGSFTQEQIRDLETNGFLEIPIGARQFKLELADVEISTSDMPGWLVASDHGITVALDITIDDNLKSEGIAREFVNRVQNLRKESGFDVTDRIQVIFHGDDELGKSIENYISYICSEILAVSVKPSGLQEGTEVEVNDKQVFLQLKKA